MRRAGCSAPSRGNAPAVAAAGASAGFYWLLIGLLYLPIVILFVFSFNASTTLVVPAARLHARLVREGLRPRPPLLTAVRNSLMVAVGSSMVATTLGTMVALLLSRFEFRGKPCWPGWRSCR